MRNSARRPRNQETAGPRASRDVFAPIRCGPRATADQSNLFAAGAQHAYFG